MELYKICSETLILIPIDSKTTKVVEKKCEKILNCGFMEIIDYNCKLNGSSYDGRFESSKLLIGSNSKLPIYIEESNNIIFLPTASSRNKKCWWISYNNIQNYLKKGNKITLLFENELYYDLEISSKIFENQINKASKLLMVTKYQKKLLK